MLDVSCWVPPRLFLCFPRGQVVVDYVCIFLFLYGDDTIGKLLLWSGNR
jgi:hypothetical protein